MPRIRSNSDPSNHSQSPSSHRSTPYESSSNLPSQSIQPTPSGSRIKRPELNPTSTLTAESLAQLSNTISSSRWPFEGTIPISRIPMTYPRESVSPSLTSLSDEFITEDPEDRQDESVVQSYAEVKKWKAWLSKGKYRAVQDGQAAGNEASKASQLPAEVLMQVFRHLQPKDLHTALTVSSSWSICAFTILWHQINIASVYQLVCLSRTLTSQAETTFDYSQAIRRLNLSNVSDCLTDALVTGLECCTRLERLNAPNADHLTPNALLTLTRGMNNLVAVDLSGNSKHIVRGVTDYLLTQMASSCPKLEAINLSWCEEVGDKGIKAIAEGCRHLRRAKFANCTKITDSAIINLVQSCPYLMEIDLAGITNLTDASLYAIFLHSSHVRELKLNWANITDLAFPNLLEMCDQLPEEREYLQSYLDQGGMKKDVITPHLGFLRIVDLTGCKGIGDAAVENLVNLAPRLRHLALTKCEDLTDQAANSITKLGKTLHHLHLGHVSNLTDDGVTKIARSCTHVRYLDLACCPLLTDLSVFEIAMHMTRLRRIGLVKVINLTDEGARSLIGRHATVERMHLSYCDKITPRGITPLLNGLPGLAHLSLSGITAFKKAEFQQYCRPVPSQFTDHQTASFCVFSGRGIAAIRNHLNAQMAADMVRSHEIASSRSSNSSSSSATLPFVPPQSHHRSHARPSATQRSNARQHNSIWGSRPGIPYSTFTSTPNFLTPEVSRPSRFQSASPSGSSTQDTPTRERPDVEDIERSLGDRDRYRASRAAGSRVRRIRTSQERSSLMSSPASDHSASPFRSPQVHLGSVNRDHSASPARAQASMPGEYVPTSMPIGSSMRRSGSTPSTPPIVTTGRWFTRDRDGGDATGQGSASSPSPLRRVLDGYRRFGSPDTS